MALFSFDPYIWMRFGVFTQSRSFVQPHPQGVRKLPEFDNMATVNELLGAMINLQRGAKGNLMDPRRTG